MAKAEQYNKGPEEEQQQQQSGSDMRKRPAAVVMKIGVVDKVERRKSEARVKI